MQKIEEGANKHLVRLLYSPFSLNPAPHYMAGAGSQAVQCEWCLIRVSITVTVTLPATEPRAPTPTSGAHSIPSSGLAWAQANNTTACQTLFSYFTYQSSGPLPTCFLLYQTLSQFKPRQNLTHLLTFHVQKHKIDNICLKIYATIIYVLKFPSILNACSWVSDDHNAMLCQCNAKVLLYCSL